MFIKDLLDLPEQVSRGDFVLRLTEGVTRPDETLADYVVTKQLVGCFDAALGLIKSALEHRSSKAAYLHGSFGAGKSHFMAVLHLLLAGNAKARGIPELSEVVAKHAAWTEGKRILLVPYHLIGARNLESAILGNYAAYMRRTHPQARAPAVYRSEKLLENADSHRQALGDAKFFAQLNPRPGQAAPSDGWGSISAGWDAASYDAARNGAPESEERRRLVGDLVDSLFPAMRETNEFVDLDDGLAVLSAHAKALGYDVLVLFLDELILWLASHAANVDFVSQEAQKVPKLVESERADRPVPIVSFVARQRDLRELVGQHITGAERLSFSDVLSWWEGRFSTISLEDRNLPAIAEKRILKPKTPEARRKMDEEFARTAALREEVRKVLLTSHSNPEDFRKLYPFSPALVETLVAVSSLLQRERTALKIMVQLLVKQRDTLQLGQIVPVGDLYDEIAQGDEAFSTDMKAHFDNAHRLYQQHLRPLLEQEHSLTFDQAAELPWGEPRCRALRNDDRLVKTLLLAALAPEVESLKQMTPGRLAALNHGTITTPIPGQEAATVLNKCKKWAAAVGQIKIQEGAGGQPTITVQLSGVDTRRILDQAESVDNHGNRVRKLKDILLQQMGIPADQELYARHEFRWRGTNRECEVIFNNVRDLPDETLHTTGDGWRLIIDYPFDTLNHTAEEDSRRLERFRAEGKEARVICWVPSFFNRKAQQDLGLLVRLDYILTENRFPTFVAHLSEVDRAAARAQLQNQRDILCGQLVSQLEMAYGLRGGGTEYLDPGNSLDASEQFHSLAPSLVLRPPVASNFKEGLAGLLDQALTSQFPAHPVQLARGQNDFSFKKITKLTELKNRSAKAAQLFAQFFSGERLVVRDGQRQAGIRARHVAQFVPANQRHRAGGAPVNFQRERTPEMGRLTGKTAAEASVQLRIACFPKPVANMNAVEIQIVPPEIQRAQGLVARRLHAIDPAALLFFVGPAGVKYNAVASLEGRLQTREYFFPFHALHRSEIDAAFLAKTAVDQLLMVDSAEPARVQSARESHFQIVARRGGETRGARRFGAKFVQSMPIDPRDVGHVFGGFEPAFNFQRRHAGAEQVRQHFQPGQVLRA